MHKTKSEDIVGLLPVLGLQEGDALAGCHLPGFLRHPSIQLSSRSLTPFVILDRGLRLATCQQRLGPSLARSLPVDVLDRRGRNWKRKGPLLHDGRSVLLFVYLTFTESPQKAKVDGEKQWDLCRKRDSPLISVTSSVVRGKQKKSSSESPSIWLLGFNVLLKSR